MSKQVMLLADIHSNAEAFRAVLDAERERGHDPGDGTIYCAGDILGYGPSPVECIQIFRELSVRSVAGNHDAAVRGTMSTEWFNFMARQAIEWTKSRLMPEDIEYLDELPESIVDNNLQVVHGSPLDPFQEYVRNNGDARRALDQASGDLLVLGHTHKPSLYREGQSVMETPEKDGWVSIDPERERVVMNPGSVGQPRDGDPQASYAIWDRDRGALCWRRVSYDVETVQSAIRGADLPERLATRLSVGA